MTSHDGADTGRERECQPQPAAEATATPTPGELTDAAQVADLAALLQEPEPPRTHLGDGAYARPDGYCVWVEAQRAGGTHRVALEPSAIVALVRIVVDQDPAMGPRLVAAARGGEGQ
jgi:hypothetical protein